jgi:AcrR family transcriptional regulator
MPKLRPEVRAERRQAFVDAAWRCAGRWGFRDLSVDDVCGEAGLSKGAFYGYFASKHGLLLALLADDAAALDEVLARIERSSADGVERLRRFARAMLAHGDDPARVQVRADLWAQLLTEPSVQHELAATIDRRRAVLRDWIERAIADGQVAPMPANALASILLALGDGLVLHGALAPGAFRWRNVRRALDALLDGIAAA